MRRTAIDMVLAVVAAALAVAAPAAASKRCPVPSDARVLDRSSEAVVYTRGAFRTYGCHRSVGRAVKLADEGGGIRGEEHRSRTAPRLAGRYVGYVTFGSAIGDEFDRVYVFDLVRRRPKSIAGSNFVSAFVLKRNGSVAWIQGSIAQPADPGQAVYEVRKISHVDRQGVVLVDRGAGIDRHSLALSGDRRSISWSHGGEARADSLR